MIQVEDLPLTWFDRPQYRPRARLAGGGEAWFILSPAVPKETRVPEGAPREPPAGRPAVRKAFEETYAAWDLRLLPAAKASLESLAAPGTAVIVAGQQPGFLAGPLYAIYKAIGAIAAARRRAALSGRPAVPVFWVAGDDHDLEEVRAGRFPAPGGGEAEFRYPHAADRRPLADYPMDAEAEKVIDDAARELGRRRHGDRARELLDLYRGRNLASGFAAVLNELLGHTGLLVLDPVRIRPLARDVFRKVIEEPAEVLAAIERGREEAASLGFEPLVAARLPLFLIQDGKRHHLAPSAAGLLVEGHGRELPRGRLLDLLGDSPALFSSGALLRPIIQEQVLPSVLTIGGPAEIGYFAQIGPLAAMWGLPPPPVALRPNATLIEGKLARLAARAGLSRIAAASSPEDLVARRDRPPSLDAVRELASRAEGVLSSAARELAPAEKTERLVAKAREVAADILRLAERIEHARAGLQAGELEGARKLWSFMFPGGTLQERRWSVLHFIAKHGTEWIDRWIDHIEEDPLRIVHRWVTFDGGDEDGDPR